MRVGRLTSDVVFFSILALKTLFKKFPDSDSEIILKIGYYLVKLRRTKMVPIFWATLYVQKQSQTAHKLLLTFQPQPCHIHLSLENAVIPRLSRVWIQCAAFSRLAVVAASYLTRQVRSARCV